MKIVFPVSAFIHRVVSQVFDHLLSDAANGYSNGRPPREGLFVFYFMNMPFKLFIKAGLQLQLKLEFIYFYCNKTLCMNCIKVYLFTYLFLKHTHKEHMKPRTLEPIEYSFIK